MIDIERRLTDELHAAVADEPPLGFDPDEVADRAGRLRRKRHRAYAMAAGAAATTAVLAVAGVVVLGDRDDAGRTGETPTATAPATPTAPTSGPASKPAACQDTPRGQVPPLSFPGSAKIVQRLDRDVPEAIAEHLPGFSIEPSDPVQARDCPPTVLAGYFLDDTALALYLIHARPGFDDEQNPYADLPVVRETDEFTAEDGAVVVVYETVRNKDGSKVVEGSVEDSLIVGRYGKDGMVTHASFAPGNTVAVADIVNLLGDPRLHFPIPQ